MTSSKSVSHWQEQSSDAGPRAWAHESGLIVSCIVPYVRIGNREFTSGGADAPSIALELATEERTDGAGAGWLVARLMARNTGKTAVAVQAVGLRLTRLKTPAPLTRHLLNGEAMVDYSAMVPVSEDRRGSWCAGLSDAAGSAALVAGFESHHDAFSYFTIMQEAGVAYGVEAECDREGIAIEPGDTLVVSPLLIGAGASLSALMDAYARHVAAVMRPRVARPETGWCSWYDYYGTETVDDIVANAAAIAASPLAEDLRVIQIDDGWNLPTPDHARVWGDWTAGAKFPEGMKAIADRLHAMNFRAGLWVAPFAVDPASRLFRDHPEWLIQDEKTGGPMSYWGVHGLDLSQDAVLDFVRETFVRVFDEWGYDYIKIDFLIYGGFRGRRARRDLTSAQCLRRGLETIAAVARDRYVLTCGCPMGPSIGVCDAQRIGPDVSGRWSVLLNYPEWPVGNCCLRAASVHTVWRQWMHGAWWQNDPDCLMVRREPSPAEKAMFGKEFGGQFATEPPFGLSDEEAGFWTRLVWLTGGLGLISDRVGELPADRLAWLRRAFPLNPHPARVVDHYTDLEVSVLRTPAGPLRVGVFNIGETPKRIVVPADRLGVPTSCRWREWATGEVFASEGTEVAFPELPARGGRIWEMV